MRVLPFAKANLPKELVRVFNWFVLVHEIVPKIPEDVDAWAKEGNMMAPISATEPRSMRAFIGYSYHNASYPNKLGDI